MKKIMSVLLVVVLVLSISVCALAEGKVVNSVDGLEKGTYKVTVANKEENQGVGYILVDNKDAWYNYAEVGYVVIIDDWYGYIYIDENTQADFQYEFRNVCLEKISDEDIGLSYQYVVVWPFEDDFTSPECFA